jgi:poly(A) polymerase
LLGLNPKDFDVATDASPEEVRALFRNCRLIGRRFRLAHVHFGREIIEVATFRAHHDEGEGEGVVENGMILRDNVFGSLEDDAWRRDFTANALYYNIADFSLVDYTGGMEDIQNRVLRIIGDPIVRFQEDPVRMLRAIRFAGKLGFELEPAMAEQISEQAECMANVPAARLFDEVLKLFLHGHALKTYELLRQYGLFKYLFAETDELLNEFPDYLDPFIRQAMINTDHRIHEDKPVTPAYLFAVLLWAPVRKQAELLQDQNMSTLQALQVAGNEVVSESVKQVSMPRRFSLPMREIWQMQARLMSRRGKRPYRLIEQPRFRAGYDFMLLRHEVGEPIAELCTWWTEFQEQDEAGRRRMTQALNKPVRRRRGPKK